MARERKRACSIRADVSLELNTVRFWAHDYETEKPVPGMDFRFELARMNTALGTQAMLKGCEDSIRDAGALGADATIGQKFAAMRERAEWLMSGTDCWVKSGRSEGEGTLLFKALMIFAPGKDEAKVLAYVRSLPRSKRDAMLASEQLKEIVAELRAESGKGVDVAELFGELEEAVSEE